MRRIGLILFLSFLASFAYPYAATDTILIDSNTFNFELEKVQLAIGDDLNLKQIEHENFEETTLPIFIKSSAITREYLRYSGDTPVEIILEPEGFHYIDVYLENLRSGNILHKKTGRLVGFPDNEMFEDVSAINKVKLTVEPNSLYKLLIYYKNPHNENIKINLSLSDRATWSDNLLKKNSSFNFWLGIFFGTLILLSLVNFIFYYLFRDRTYMVYVAYIFTILVYEASLFGFFDKSFFKYIPEFLPLLSNTTLLLFITFYLLFLSAFIDLKKNYSRWHKLFRYLISIIFLLLIITNFLIFIGRPISGFVYRNIGLLLIIPIAIVFLINVVFSKRSIDRVFFTGSIFLVISGVLSIISYFNNNYGNSDIYLQAGILIEVVIFNIGLGLRSKIIQNDKDAELHKLIVKLRESEEKQKTLNASLEEKVDERTHKINDINQELTQQRDQLFDQKVIIEQNLSELNDVRKNLVHTVYQKTKELRHANKELVAQNAQLEQYAFITAHNLKAPVARLKGLVNIFELTNKRTKSNHEIVSRIKEASFDMDDVISDINKILQIKNFSKQERSKVQLDHLIKKINKRLEDKIHENNSTIEVDLGLATIQSIETYLESILYNLIYNGIKYRREGVDSVIRILSYKQRNRNIIEISDNGIGIDLDSYGEKIFGLYQRFHDHITGKGIGLYLVKTQVEALNGKISIESEVDKGTTFKLSFPVK